MAEVSKLEAARTAYDEALDRNAAEIAAGQNAHFGHGAILMLKRRRRGSAKL
jgi:hypothetical protein